MLIVAELNFLKPQNNRRMLSLHILLRDLKTARNGIITSRYRCFRPFIYGIISRDGVLLFAGICDNPAES